MASNDQTKLYGVLGHPVAHSLSPFIMNRAFRLAGIDGVYLRFDVEPKHLDRAVAGLQALGARGVNVTYPFKEAVLAHVDVPSPDVQLIGAVNTVSFVERQVVGHNTDAPGAAIALETVAGVSARDRHFFVFGAGGSARAAAVGLLRAGAGSVVFGVRDPKNVVEPVARLRDEFPLQYIDIVPLADRAAGEDLRQAFQRADVVINATPVGMGRGTGHSLVGDPEWIRPQQLFFDFVYQPGNTEFLETASTRGAGVLGGLALLVCQAVESFRQWTGEHFDAPAMLEAIEAAFPERTIS